MLGTGPKKVYTRESQELKEIIREVAGAVLVELFHIYLISWPLYATLHMHIWVHSVAKWLKYTVEIELRKIVGNLGILRFDCV